MPSFDSTASRTIFHKLPSPIALPARRYEDAREGALKAARLFECVDSTLSTLALIAATDHVSRGGHGIGRALDEALRRPGPLAWWRLLLAAAGEATGDSRSFAEELEILAEAESEEAVLLDDGEELLEGPTPFVRELVALVRTQSEEAARWRAAVELLLERRTTPGLDRSTLLEALPTVLCAETDEALRTMLLGLRFLSQYTLLLPLVVLDGHQRRTVIGRRLHGTAPSGSSIVLETDGGHPLTPMLPMLVHPNRDEALLLHPLLAAHTPEGETEVRPLMLAQVTDDGKVLHCDRELGRLVELGLLGPDGEHLTTETLLTAVHEGPLLPGFTPESRRRLAADCGTIPVTPETPEIYRTALLLRRDATSEVLLAGDDDAYVNLWLRVLHPAVGCDGARVRGLHDRAIALLEPPSDRLLPVGDFGFASGIGRFVTTVMVEDGTNLADRLACEGALSISEAIRVGTDVVHALSALQRAGVALEPVRAAQVLLSDDGSARLATFPLGPDVPGENGAELGVLSSVGALLRLMLGPDAESVPDALHSLIATTSAMDGSAPSLRELGRSLEALGRELPSGSGIADRTAQQRFAFLQSLCSGAQVDRARRAQAAADAGDWETAVLSLEELADGAWEPAERQGALVRAAHIYADKLGDPSAARTAFESVLELDPTSADAAEHLEKDAEAREDWGRLSELLLDRFAQTPDDETKAAILRRLAPIFEERLNDVDAAFFVLRRLLEVDHGPDRLVEIERLAAATQRWSDLVQAYDALLPEESGEAAAALLIKSARVLHERLEDPAKARERLQQAIELAPLHKGALGTLAELLSANGEHLEAARLLERLASTLEGTERAETLGRAADAAERGEAWAEAAVLLQSRAALLDNEQAAAVWTHLGALQSERLGATDAARAAYEHALMLRPSHTDALVGLESLARGRGDGALLRETLERRIAAAGADPDARQAALRHLLASAAEAGLDEGALAATHRGILDLDPNDVASLAALADLAVAGERWEEAAELMERRARLLEEDDATSLLLDLSRLVRDNLQDAPRAAKLLEIVKDRRPDDRGVADELLDAYRMGERWDRLVGLLEHRGIAEEDEVHRGALLTEAASVALNHLADEPRAIALYETVLDLAPTHSVAARELGAIYQQRGELERAMPLLQTWADGIDATVAPQEAVAAYLGLARAAEELLRHDAAREAYSEVIRIEPDHVDGLLGVANTALAVSDTEGAIETYRKILDTHGDSLPSEVRASVRGKLGELTMRTGSPEESRKLLEKAHAEDPNDEKTLRDLIEACDRLEDWAASVQHRLSLGRLMGDRIERAAMFMQAGDVAHDRLKDTRAAIEAYKAAQLQMPDSKAAAARLLRLFLEVGDYEESIDTLRRLVDLEEDRKKKASHMLTLALIYRDHLRDDRRAVAYLHETLDNDPLRLEAFEALDAILVRRKAWEEQAESYERMLERVSAVQGQEALAFRLLLNQAEILMNIRATDRAIFALEKARALRPQDVDTRISLAKLLELDDSTVEDAVSEYRAVLRLDGSRAEAYHALRRLFTKTKQADAAWCACGVLSLISEAEEKERAYYEAHRTGALKVSHTIKTEDTWPKHLYGDAQDPVIGALLRAVYEAVPERFHNERLDTYGITVAHRIDLRARSPFNSFATTIPRILGVEVPTFYLSPTALGIHKISTAPPAFVLGREVHEGMKGKRLRFTLGKAMSYLHPPHLVATMQPAAALQAALEAVYLLLSGNALQVEKATAEVKDWFSALEQALPGARRDALRPHAEALFRTGTRPDVASWLVQVEMTANHAGLLLCNDIEVAVDCLENEASPPTKVAAREKIKELVRYALSGRYHALRRDLGIAISDEETPAQRTA